MWHQHLGPQAVPAYYSMLHRMTLDLVRDLQDGKQSVHDALHMYVFSRRNSYKKLLLMQADICRRKGLLSVS